MAKEQLTVYLDVDTNPLNLIADIGSWCRKFVYPMLVTAKNTLAGKSGGFFSVIITVQVMNKELSKMHAFFRTAVMEFYWRQENGIWENRAMTVEEKEQVVDEIKHKIGFFLFNEAGKPLMVNGKNEYNSFAVFKETKSFKEKLDEIEAVCFTDNGYKYPDTERFKANVKLKGESYARNIELADLLEWAKNKHAGRELPK